jgi:hypothetical protein
MYVKVQAMFIRGCTGIITAVQLPLIVIDQRTGLDHVWSYPEPLG